MGFVGILALVTVMKVVLAQTCVYPNPCWPSDDAWNGLNQTLGGSLFRARPPAYVCHVPTINETACSLAKANWTNEFWRAEQPGGYFDPDSESGDSNCNIDDDPNIPCDQGLVPQYVAKVKDITDVQSAVNFAREHKLSTRVKGASHDFLGRSSGNGTFGISTIDLKGIDFEDNFQPQGAPADSGISGESVVHVAAGESWIFVIEAADAKGLVLVSGFSESVGAAGGWILGAGHSIFSPQYGLGVDNVLQFEIVTPDGNIRTANQYQEQELFWALRGGGPGFGVLTKVTYRTHPKIHQIIQMELNITYTPASYPSFLKNFFRIQSAFLASNITGYLFPSPVGFSTITFVPNSADISATNATLLPLYYWAEQESASGRPVEVQNSFTVLSSYLEFWSVPPNSPAEGAGEGAGVPRRYGSRLLPLNVFEDPNTADQLVDLLVNSPANPEVIMMLVTGGKVSEVAPDATAVSPSWRNSSCLFAFVSTWTTNTSFSERDAIRQNLTDITQALGRLAPEAGSYVNEGDINEPDWSNTFWGSNYDRLLGIKNAVDPYGIFTCYHCVGYSTES